MVPQSEIETPTKVQKLQRTLYRKAKENGRWRAWSLYGDLCRRDVLETALRAVTRNAGAAGVDGVTTQQVKATAAAILDELQTQLRMRSYRPSPVLRVWIPKPDGKQRPLGIPTVKDRIVQMALLILLQPVFEADFHEDSYGYRPGRNAHQALDAIRAAIWKGKYEIIDADLSGYFDTIAHAGLLRLVARRVSDGSILALVKAFLKAPIVEDRFLSFEVSWRKSRTTGRHYPHVEPSKKARQKLRNAVRRELNHWTTGRSVTETIRTVNQVVRGWSHYFHYGHCTRTFVGMQDWLRQRYRKWLWKKYGRTLGYHTFFTNDRLQGQYQLFTLPSYAPRRR